MAAHERCEPTIRPELQERIVPAKVPAAERSERVRAATSKVKTTAKVDFVRSVRRRSY